MSQTRKVGQESEQKKSKEVKHDEGTHRQPAVKKPAETEREDREKKKTRQTLASSVPPLLQHPPCQAAQQRARQQADLMNMSLEELMKTEKTFLIDDEEPTSTVFQITVSLPENQKELKKFTRDATTWVSNKLKKSSELQWNKIPQHRLKISSEPRTRRSITG